MTMRMQDMKPQAGLIKINEIQSNVVLCKLTQFLTECLVTNFLLLSHSTAILVYAYNHEVKQKLFKCSFLINVFKQCVFEFCDILATFKEREPSGF